MNAEPNRKKLPKYVAKSCPNVESARESDSPDDLPAWQESFPAPPGEYSLFRRYGDVASAEAIQSILESEPVPCYIEPRATEPRLFNASIRRWVETRPLHRARWILDQSELSEAELCYLATGELPGSD